MSSSACAACVLDEALELSALGGTCGGAGFLERRDDFRKRLVQKVGVVTHELDGSVDLVCDAGGEAPHGFELLRHVELLFELALAPDG